MSLVVSIYVPEGIVLSSDSRVIINTSSKANEVIERTAFVLSDSVKKVKILKEKFGIAAYGQVSLKNLPIVEHLDIFENQILTNDTQIDEIPNLLLEFFTKNYEDVSTVFYVAGYKTENNNQIPHIYLVDIRQKLTNRLNQQNNNIVYNASWGGETEILTRIFSQVKVKNREDWNIIERGNVYYEFVSLKEAVELSRFYIQASEKLFKLQLKYNSVGGDVNSVVIPKKSLPYLIEN